MISTIIDVAVNDDCLKELGMLSTYRSRQDRAMNEIPRITEHEYGFIIFINPELKSPFISNDLNTIYKLATENDCTLINIDCDAVPFPLED